MSSQNARKSLDKHDKSALDRKLPLALSTGNSSQGNEGLNNNPYDLSNNFPCNGFKEGPFEDDANQMTSDGNDITLLDMLQWSIQPPHPIASSKLKSSKKLIMYVIRCKKCFYAKFLGVTLISLYFHYQQF